MQTLAERRKELKLSQAALGAKVGVDGMTVSRWERGESLPQRRYWNKLEEVTGLSISAVIAPAKRKAA